MKSAFQRSELIVWDGHRGRISKSVNSIQLPDTMRTMNYNREGKSSSIRIVNDTSALRNNPFASMSSLPFPPKMFFINFKVKVPNPMNGKRKHGNVCDEDHERSRCPGHPSIDKISPRTAKVKAEVKLADIASQKLRPAVEGVSRAHSSSPVHANSTPSPQSRSNDSSCKGELGIAEWIGECTSKSQGRRYFCEFSKNGQQIGLNDCVYVKSAEKDKIWLMKITQLWEEEDWNPTDASDINMFFRGIWLYRPSDTPQGPNIALHPREVFISDWEDDNTIECVQTKCHVSFRSSPPDKDEEISGVHFVCWRSFSISTSQVSLYQMHGNESVKSCNKLMKEAMREELAMGRLMTVRINPREGASARLLLRRAGHMFADAMIHMPTSHITRILLASDTETMVLFKGEEEEIVSGATYRKHVDKGLVEIELLAVRGSVQRQGYGGVMVDAVAGAARQCGMEALMTYADDTAVGFFEACGFEIVVTPLGNKLKLSAYDNSILMRMPLHAVNPPPRLDLPHRSCSLI